MAGLWLVAGVGHGVGTRDRAPRRIDARPASATGRRMSTAIASAGTSSAANWLSSSDRRHVAVRGAPPTRAAMVARSPARWTKRTSPATAQAVAVRLPQRRAGQHRVAAAGADRAPSRRRCDRARASDRRRSSGCRPPSSRRSPAGWKSSASKNRQPRAAASASPTVVLPQPQTPITTTIIGPLPRRHAAHRAARRPVDSGSRHGGCAALRPRTDSIHAIAHAARNRGSRNEISARLHADRSRPAPRRRSARRPASTRGAGTLTEQQEGQRDAVDRFECRDNARRVRVIALQAGDEQRVRERRADEPQRQQQRDLAPAERRDPPAARSPASTTTGSSASAAQRFCQNAMSAAGRRATWRRLSTASSAKVNPETIPHSKPAHLPAGERELGNHQHQSGDHQHRGRHVASAPARPRECAFQQQHEQRKAGEAKEPRRHVGRPGWRRRS